jgi:PAS domain S-box-containing protein
MAQQITAIRYFGLKIQFWPVVLISMLGLKIVLSVALKQGDLAEAYGSICYFLLILLATSFSTVNALKNKQDGRIFWMFIAAGCALWLVDQWLYLYYEFVVKGEIPDNSLADPVLFLHIVPFMAAVAFAPHLQSTRLKLYRPALNFLLLLFFWIFLYAYLVFPHQYLFPDSQLYNDRFDFLYRIENLALVLVIGFYCLRGKQPWRPVYLNLLGACTLYALSSAFANVAITAELYSNRAVYAFGLNASAAWFAWSALRWGKLPEEDVAANSRERGVHASGPLWALMVVLAIPFFGIWDLVTHEQSPDIRNVRQFIVLAALVAFAVAAMLKGYFSERELRADVRRNLLQSALSEAAFGACEASRKEIDTVYREFTETVPAIVWRMDPVTLQLISVNQHAKEILGYPAENWTANPQFWKDAVHPDDRDRVLELLTRSAAHPGKFDFECRMIAADGRVVWLRTDAKIVHKGGGPAELVGVALDVTERKRIREALQKSEEKFSKAFRHGPLAISLSNAKTQRYIDVNDTFERLTGYQREEVIGKTPSEFSLWADPSQRTELLNRLFHEESVQNVEIGIVHKSGRILVGLASAEIIEIDGEPCMLGVVADITERKQAERTLQEIGGRLLTAQEEERRRIATELLDDIGQDVALLAIRIQHSQHGNPEAPALLEEFSDLTREIVSKISRLSHQLHSSELDFLGLGIALEVLCRRFKDQYGIETHCTCQDVPPKLDSNYSLCFYRVAQAALDNVVKHSRSEAVELELLGDGKELSMIIRDFGDGFEVTSDLHRTNLGLISMRERMHSIGGDMELSSRAGEGTEVRASAPLPPEQFA